MRCRLMQLLMLAVLGGFFVVAALADPVFGSKTLGWYCLGGMLLAVIGLWWAGHQADKDI